jgi:hypothetical protein
LVQEQEPLLGEGYGKGVSLRLHATITLNWLLLCATSVFSVPLWFTIS